MEISTDNPTAETQTFVWEFKRPVFAFTPPYFKGLQKPETIYFYTMKEARKFLKKLPKDWLIHLLTNKY